MEIMALEKLKENAVQVQTRGEAERVDETNLITHRPEPAISLGKSRSCSSVPIVDTNIIPNFSRKTRISSLYGGFLLTSSEANLNVTPDEICDVHDSVFSDTNDNPTFAQVLSRDTTDTTPPVSSIGPACLTRGTSEKVKSEPSASLTLSLSQDQPEVPLRLSMKGKSDIIGKQPNKLPEIVSSSVIEPRSNLGSVEARVQKLVEDLNSSSIEVIRAALAELRSLAKPNTENRIMIAEHGAISILVKLLYSTDAIIQEHAVTTLLNLSIYGDNKLAIAQANVIDPLIHVLNTGTPEAKENSAATFFSLAMVEENRVNIGRSGAIGPLVELLRNGTPRGRKDATTALFYLSMLPENKIKIVQAGAVKHLVELMDPSVGVVDKTVAVLANLATIQEGKIEIGREGGIPVLVEAVELGSARGKENAAAALLRICSISTKFCIMALQEGVIPPLVALSHSGTRRAKNKAQDLLNLFSKHVHNNVENR